MKKRIVMVLLISVLAGILLTGCIPGDDSYSANDPANFLSGVWHGWIAPISLIISLFNHDIQIYEPINTGWWYDFGFYIAIISGFGGISLSRKKRKSRD
ncbi:hypothetical protein [Sporosalibacterium faouarense]|uniref:hypothetical protein n=1 Tax=Sporosalibacterium faouarense TaxID=516123 RepID=UPI00141CC0FF|nr:hypothetical protein [Sporosalibacterium faouarense]MTI46529.1 hypothetical protein [Bacillota bacterium]